MEMAFSRDVPLALKRSSLSQNMTPNLCRKEKTQNSRIPCFPVSKTSRTNNKGDTRTFRHDNLI